MNTQEHPVVANDFEIDKASQTPDSLRLRERFFVPVSPDAAQAFCIDDRYSKLKPYIGVTGGLAGFVTNFTLMREALKPGSVTDTGNYAADTAALTPLLMQQNIHFGVHSDQASEQGDILSPINQNSSVGCGFVQNQQPIQAHIFDHGRDIIDTSRGLAPHLFTTDQDIDFAEAVVAASGRLSNSAYFSCTPREVIQAAVDNGAPTMVVEGSHDARSIGIINFVPNTTFDSATANHAGLPAYNHDTWSVSQTLHRVQDVYPHNASQQAIIEILCTVGTMSFLGAPEVVARY